MYKSTLRLPKLDGTEELFEFTELKDASDLQNLNLWRYDLNYDGQSNTDYIRMGADLSNIGGTGTYNIKMRWES